MSLSRNNNFELSAVGYEIAGNPWAFIILADGCVAGYLCCDELQGGELMIKKFVVGAEFQRRGIGSAALELLRAAAREAGCRQFPGAGILYPAWFLLG